MAAKPINATIPGRVTRGVGAAARALPLQWPILVKYTPELNPNFYQATLNVQLAAPLVVINPDATIPVSAWSLDRPNNPPLISMVRIQLEWPIGGPQRDAWIYLPRSSPHAYNLLHAEIITDELKGIAQGQECLLHFGAVGFVV